MHCFLSAPQKPENCCGVIMILSMLYTPLFYSANFDARAVFEKVISFHVEREKKPYAKDFEPINAIDSY